MHLSYFVLCLIALSTGLASCYPYDPELDLLVDREKAMQFIENMRNENMQKRMLYTGQEQRREVKERYEEKCERKLLGSVRNKPRWCPELSEWNEWNKVAANDPVPEKGKIFG